MLVETVPRRRLARGWARRALIRLLAVALLVITGYAVVRALVLAGIDRPVLVGVTTVFAADAIVSWLVIESQQRRERALARVLAQRPPLR